MGQQHLGSMDAPLIPGTRFRVHDGTRPQPRPVSPGTASTQEQPGEPPSDAVRLFGGTDLSHWMSVHGGVALGSGQVFWSCFQFVGDVD
jgi:hypothetical protein